MLLHMRMLLTVSEAHYTIKCFAILFTELGGVDDTAVDVTSNTELSAQDVFESVFHLDAL